MELIPLISIVIPVYNREKYIEQAILSAVNQTYSNIEIIIGDNKSTDSTWEILKKWAEKDSRIKIFQNETNIGPVLNWSECFKRATGEYIKILWSDDWMSLDFIEKALDVFTEDTAFVISGIQLTDGTNKIEEIHFKKRVYTQKEYWDDIFLYNKEYFPVSPGCALFRKKDILKNFVIDIPNHDHLDSKNNGAGNDQLIFLGISMDYRYIKTLESVDSFFRAHQDSFTIANKLDLYYCWGKLYFLQYRLQDPFYQNIMKCRLYKKKLKDPVYLNISKIFSWKTSLSFHLYKFLINKYKR